jgi:predicted permease
MTRDPQPPRLARWIASLTAEADQRDAQVGDLWEEFSDRAERDRAAARRWYWRQALGSAVPNLVHRARRLRRATRNQQGDGMMETLFQNMRMALRNVRRNVAFSAVVVLTLGIGIGANATIFSAIYGLVLNPFPFPEPNRIVGVGTAYPRLSSGLGFFENMSPLEYVDIREQARTLEDVVAWDMGNRQIAGDGPPQNVFTGFWWGDALRTLGMDAHLGRGFSDEEVTRGDAVALLSYRIWRDRFGADSTMVGQGIVINDVPYTVIGILPEGVNLYGMDLWTVLNAQPDMWPRNRRQFQTMARIAEGSSLREVNAELEGLARRTQQTYGAEFDEYQGWSMVARTWNDVNSQFFRAGLYLVMGAVAFVLLLISANTANLLLARAQARRREMAVRTAMGAGRGRLAGQLLTESVTLASLGGLVGVGVAYAGAAGLQDLLTRMSLPVAGGVEMNGPVLAFTAAVAVGVGGQGLDAQRQSPAAAAHARRRGGRLGLRPSRRRRAAGEQLPADEQRGSRVHPGERADHAADPSAAAVQGRRGPSLLRRAHRTSRGSARRHDRGRGHPVPTCGLRVP